MAVELVVTGSSGKTTFPKVCEQLVVMEATMRHTEKKEDMEKMVGLVGCETSMFNCSFLMLPRVITTEPLCDM